VCDTPGSKNKKFLGEIISITKRLQEKKNKKNPKTRSYQKERYRKGVGSWVREKKGGNAVGFTNRKGGGRVKRETVGEGGIRNAEC